jgi:hypothetical protein
MRKEEGGVRKELEVYFVIYTKFLIGSKIQITP